LTFEVSDFTENAFAVKGNTIRNKKNNLFITS